jgi:hypothetical protein
MNVATRGRYFFRSASFAMSTPIVTIELIQHRLLNELVVGLGLY